MGRIIVYGAPRTGTNYIEFLVRNNVGCEYVVESKKLPNYIKEETAILKHCKPVADLGCKYILVLKYRKNFYESYTKWNKNLDISCESLYDEVLRDYLTFYRDHPNDCFIIFHEQFIGQEEAVFTKMCTKFGFSIKHPFVKTNMRMSKDSGLTTIDEEYIFAKNTLPELEEEPFHALWNLSQNVEI